LARRNRICPPYSHRICIFEADKVENLLHPSKAGWALARRREGVLSKLVESKECSRAMIQKTSAALQLSRAMVFRLLARYRQDRRLNALLLRPRGRKRGSGGLQKRAGANYHGAHPKVLSDSRKTACRCPAPRDCGRLRQEPTWHPLLRVRFAAFAGFRSAHVRFKAQRASAVQRAGHCPKPLERLAVYWFPEKAVYPLTVNME